MAPHFALVNLATFMWYPLDRRACSSTRPFASASLGPHTGAYYLVVFLTFVLALAVNFIGVFAYQVLFMDGSIIGQAVRETCSRSCPRSCSLRC